MTDNDLRSNLRSYYQAVAADRPVDGELERVVATTARIRPMPAWQVQLAAATDALRAPLAGGLQLATWLALLLLALALLALGLVVASRPAAATPFEGRWEAVDVDGSDMLMVVSGGTEPSVRFEDFYASRCAGEGDSNTHWVSAGVGTIEGERMNVRFPNGGGCTAWQIAAYEDSFVLEPGSNMISDSSGVIWRRPSDATPFEGRWVALDTDGSVMYLVVSAGKEPSVRYEDLYATVCADNGDTDLHFVSDGQGNITGNLLTVSYRDGGCTSYRKGPYDLTYAFDVGASILNDAQGNLWRRPPPR